MENKPEDNRRNTSPDLFYDATENEIIGVSKRKDTKKIARKLKAYGPKATEVFNTIKMPADLDQEELWKEIQSELEKEEKQKEPNEEEENSKENNISHITEIKKLIEAFFSDFEGSTFDLLSGMLLVMLFHGFREDLTGNKLDPGDSDLKSGRYFMKFAAAAYGNMLACLKMRKKFFQFWWGDSKVTATTTTTTTINQESAIPQENIQDINVEINLDSSLENKKKRSSIISVPPKGDKRVVFEHTGIAQEDFIVGRWGAGIARGGSKFLPGYYLCVDRYSKNVVLALRGSSNLNDALTDMVGNYQPYRDGAVHRGMFHMTKNLMEHLEEIILSTIAAHEGFGFVVCGHSLGAGITSLFTLVFHDTHPEIPIHGYAYACPCTMDATLAKYCDDFMTTYVHGDDCVSRISLGSLDELKLTMQHFLEASGKSLTSR